MKFPLIAAVVLIALAQGSFASNPDSEVLTQYIEEIKAKVRNILNNPGLAEHAQGAMENVAAQVHEQVKNVDEQIRPMADQMLPVLENLKQKFEDVLEKITDEAKALQH